MTSIDWVVLVGTITFISAYGVWKTRSAQSAANYLKGGGEARWVAIGLSIMATQASAITFLSVPGLAYEQGMRFVQFYFALPIAMVIVSAVFVPIYYRLEVYTAYEFLERRFDLRLRLLGALLFLIGRGLAAGITIYAPAIILASVLGWSLNATVLGIGIVVILYTVLGGTRAVTQTQKQQMIVIMSGMVIAGGVLLFSLPPGVGLDEAAGIAGALGRMNVVDFNFDFNDRYNFWSGMTAALFLFLSYFGTDQSQVQRYLGGKSSAESRLGILFNGIFKIPMQALILFIGILVLVFYVFEKPPVFFNTPAMAQVATTEHAPKLEALEARHDVAFDARRVAAQQFLATRDAGGEAHESARATLTAAQAEVEAIHGEAADLLQTALGEDIARKNRKDSDYIFIHFVLTRLPVGLVGLLVAVILLAAMSSTASELNALGTTTTVDLYARLFKREASDTHMLWVSKGLTAAWGLLALAFASFASLLDNLIEAVNILGSLFYGPILGIFLVGFFLKKVGATAVFVGALVAQGAVVGMYFGTEVGYLWFNLVGCGVVLLVASTLQVALGPDTAGR